MKTSGNDDCLVKAVSINTTVDGSLDVLQEEDRTYIYLSDRSRDSPVALIFKKSFTLNMNEA